MTNIDTQRETNFAVTLTPCSFKENTYIARVPRKTVTTDQILDLIVNHNVGIDRYQVGHAMELLKKEILEQAKLVSRWILWKYANSTLHQKVP